MRPSTGTVLIVVIVAGLILGGTLYWETTGHPSPLCGGCYHYNAPGCVVYPCPAQEALSVEASQVTSPTNVTLTVRNLGSASVGLVSYSVKDAAGNQYTKTNWAGPTIATNTVAVINIVIDGSAFTFQSKNTYTIIVTTARNILFTFTITA
jgi:hypothetical protein